MSDLDAKLDEMLDGGEAPEAEQDPEAQPESTPAPEVKFAALDAVMPDDDSVPEGYRGKKLTDVVRVAEQHKHEAGVAAERNQHWNRMQAERDAAKLALEFFQRERQEQAAPQQPREPDEDYLQRLATQPREMIRHEAQEVNRPVQEELRQTREEIFRMRADNARISAMDGLGIPREIRDEISGDVGTFMAFNNWPANDPRAWEEATRRYLDRAIRTSQRLVPPQQTPQLAVDVPRPGAPPNGNARSQSRPANPSRLKPALKENIDSIAEAAGLDPKRRAALEKFAAENVGGN